MISFHTLGPTSRYILILPIISMIEVELTALADEISSLENEVATLQQSHDSVFRTVAQFEADNKHKNLTKLPLPKPQLLSEDPPLIHFSYFDDLINQYFQNTDKTEEVSPAQENVLGEIGQKYQGANLALRELVWRLGGVLAFPINNRLYDELSDALMGIRFDVLSHVSRKFVLPHYIILRRREDKLALTKWLVFRYTTPQYVPLDRFSHHLEKDDLCAFAENVREILVKTQYKHDKLEKVGKIKELEVFDASGDASGDGLLVGVEKDLECRRVLLSLKEVTVELECGLSEIENVHCKIERATNEQLLFAEMQLKGCNFNNLQSQLLSLAKYLRSHNLI